MRESKLEKDIVKYAKKLGYDSFKFVSPGRRGVPDRAFINRRGMVIFMEIKAPGKKPSPLQQREIDRMNIRREDLAVCVDNMFDAGAFLHENI